MDYKKIGTALILVGILTLLSDAQARGQSAQVIVDGDSAGPVGVATGATAVLDVVGPASQPFALGIGFHPATIPTPSGTLGIDPFDPNTFIFLDGFDTTHPQHGVSFLSVLGQFTLFAVPFQGSPNGFSIWTQALVMDPTHPEGVVLSNTLEVASVQPPPTVTRTSPNYTSAGGTVYVTGSNFDQTPQNNVVMVGDMPCTVLSGGSNWLLAQLPLDAQSGPVSVTTSSGTGGGNPDKVLTWCAVATTPYDEGLHPSVITDTTTVIGLIAAPGEKDLYTIVANEGEEIFVEVY
ncbi:MAG: IPT/TIG domain-containing protein, partial [Planctomycetes bacterium]|nr:IPT/TIG domain-containing protein [Planctomycetota bacterium]